MIKLKVVQPKDKELLWNINQKYLYEMTNFYNDHMDQEGNYHYGYFDAYFSDPKRTAYFIFNDDTLIGFAMLCPYSNINASPDYVMAEFTIFPHYRRKHYALEAVKLIFAKHQGKWEIKYNEKNKPAKKLWELVSKKYSPQKVKINEEETVLVFENH